MEAMEVKPTIANHIKQLFNSSDEVYPMTSPRGRVLIIHNEEFDEACNADQDCLDDRVGSEFDLKNLNHLFEALDFIVVPLSDLSSQDLLNGIKDEIKHPDHEKYGMFIMVILSHGDEGVIYGSDSRKVSINDITRRLSVKNFPTMADKPKMVIIQACAGCEDDNTVYKFLKDNSGNRAPAPRAPARVAKSTVSDFIIVQASYPGFKSIRHSLNGTFMIQAFIDVMLEYSCHDNVHEIVVKVRNKVLEMCEKFADENIGAQTVHSSETLRKKLYFFPGMSPLHSMDDTRAPPQSHQKFLTVSNPRFSATASSPHAPSAPPSARASASPSARASASPSARASASPSARVRAPTPAPRARAAVPSTKLKVELPQELMDEEVKVELPLKLASPQPPIPTNLTLKERITTPGSCFTVTHHQGQIIHGGYEYPLTGLDFNSQLGGGLIISVCKHNDSLYVLQCENSYKNVHVINLSTQAVCKSVIRYKATGYINHLTVSNNHIIITDRGSKSVKVYSTSNFTHQFDIKSEHLSGYPHGITRLPDGSIVVSDRAKGLVCNLTLERNPTTKWVCKDLEKPTGITLDSDSQFLLVTSLDGRKIYIMSFSGEVIRELSSPDLQSSLLDISVCGNELAVTSWNQCYQVYEIDYDNIQQ